MSVVEINGLTKGPQSLERGETGLQATCGSGIGREADEL